MGNIYNPEWPWRPLAYPLPTPMSVCSTHQVIESGSEDVLQDNSMYLCPLFLHN